jgi:hypothetical protein
MRTRTDWVFNFLGIIDLLTSDEPVVVFCRRRLRGLAFELLQELLEVRSVALLGEGGFLLERGGGAPRSRRPGRESRSRRPIQTL